MPLLPSTLANMRSPGITENGLDHGVGHLVSMTTEKTQDSLQIGIAIR
jgi:hypothetical protein